MSTNKEIQAIRSLLGYGRFRKNANPCQGCKEVDQSPFLIPCDTCHRSMCSICVGFNGQLSNCLYCHRKAFLFEDLSI
jgi:hypothetical protein